MSTALGAKALTLFNDLQNIKPDAGDYFLPLYSAAITAAQQAYLVGDLDQEDMEAMNFDFSQTKGAHPDSGGGDPPPCPSSGG